VVYGWYGMRDGSQLFYPLLVGFAAVIVISWLTPPESADRLQRFFALLHTPVGEEEQMERAGLKVTLD
jgi:hypothetical protein